MAFSSLLLFGPVSQPPTKERLVELQQSLREDPNLKFLTDEIRTLPSLLPHLQEALPEVDPITGADELATLHVLTGSPFPRASWTRNIVLAPLTIISQIVDFWHSRRGEAEHMSFPGTDNVQGFCLGFLTATALAISRSPSDFRQSASIALRLAVCIGSVIDLRESPFHNYTFTVRWKSDLGKEAFEAILKDCSSAYISCFTDTNTVTVVVSSQEEAAFTQSLFKHGLSVRLIGTQGRYHDHKNSKAVQGIKDLCRRDTRLQFPRADHLALPLRSNIDASLIKQGYLHDIALESILAQPSQWYQTLKTTIQDMGNQRIEINAMGAEPFVPRSLTSNLNYRTTPTQTSSSKLPDSPQSWIEIPNKSPLPGQSSPRATPNSGDNLSVTDTAMTNSGVAIVGLACRFPKAESLEDYWRLISTGTSAVEKIPQSRFDPAKFWRDPKGPFWGNFLTEPDVFDHRFFSISGREAKSMDPQQRLLLQVVYEAMESSGYYQSRVGDRSTSVGCYIGVGSVDYEDNVASENASAFSALGTLRAFISGRAIQAGECSIAVAGGVNVMTSPKLFQNLAAGGFLNPTGASKAFDASANGYCRGEGAGVVVLKPMAQAMADGDSILGVIAGSAVNQGSNCSPITVPVTESQSYLYQKALAAAGISASEVTYVEAHGTGTPVGDPIECESIRRTFGGPHRAEEMYLGSVKDNIGHAEAASGVAALIKTVLMMQKHLIPKQANFSSLNPRIPPLEQDRVSIPKQNQPWKSSDVRSAVINNYGAAGSNAAIVLQEYLPTSDDSAAPPQLSSKSDPKSLPFSISAKTPESLRSFCAALRDTISTKEGIDDPNALADFAYNLATKQNRDLEYHWTATSGTCTALSHQLENAAAGTSEFSKSPSNGKPVVLCFGGQTGRTANISRDLFDESRLLQSHLRDCDVVCQTLGLSSIFPGIFQPEPVEDVIELHCQLFCVQYACAKSWLDSGLEVDTLMGHSFGQLTALCVAGAMSLEDGLRLASTRARLIRDEWGPETGAMLAIEGKQQEVEDLLRKAKERLPSGSCDIACYNGPQNFVLAGDRASIENMETIAHQEKPGARLKIQRLKNTHAFHSQLVDGILPGLETTAETIRFRTPLIPVETCTATESWSNVDARGIVQHSREPVYFAAAVARIAKRLGSAIWLEAGSSTPIIPMIKRTLSTDSSTPQDFYPLNLAGAQAQSELAETTCALWMAGSKVQYWSFHRSQRSEYRWINLPPYQFEKTRHWLEFDPSPGQNVERAPEPNVQSPELLTRISNGGHETLFSINPAHDIFDLCTKGHAVLHHSLCPASMYFELVIRAVKMTANAASTNTLPRIQALEISSPLSVSSNNRIFLRLENSTRSDQSWQFTLFSHDALDPEHQITHASGLVSLLASDANEVVGNFRSFSRLVGIPRCELIMNDPAANGLNGAIIYKTFGRVVNYAEYYRGVKRISAKEHEAVGHVQVPKDQPVRLDPGCCDPVAIDNFLQVSGIHVNCLWECNDDEVFVCTAIRELSFSDHFMNKPSDKRDWTVYSNFEPSVSGQVVNDIFVLDPASGELVVTVIGAKFTRLPLKLLSRTLSKLNDTSPNSEPSGLNNHSESNNVAVEPPKPETSDKEDTLDGDSTIASDQGDQEQVFPKLQSMLSEVLEMKVEEIQPESALADLGVDSLMVTEVISEIKTHFGISISNAEFQDLVDIQSLCLRLNDSPEAKKGPTDVRKSSATDHSSPIPASTVQGDMCNQESFNPISQSSKGLGAAALECFDDARWAYDTAANETGFSGFYRHVHPLQSKLVLAYVVEAFKALGCPLSSLSPESPLPEIRYSSKHEKVVQQYYKVLSEANIITVPSRSALRTTVQVPEVSAKDLYSQIIQEFPHHASEHKLLHITGSKLAKCLIEEEDPIGLLFGNATARALMTDVYTNAPMFKAGTIVLGQYLSELFEKSDEKNHEIKILELGAGTGGTTSYLVDLLARSGRKFQYTFSDLSSSLVTAAKKKYAKYEFMKCTTLDIEQPPASQHCGQYDVVLSTNCIHATKNLVTSTSNIKAMLRPGGVLCLVELTRNLFWFDLVFGLLEGWWLFNDGRQHVLASDRLWERNLQQAGFQWVDWTEGESEESQVLRVIVASPSNAKKSEPQHVSRVPNDGPLPSQETIQFDETGGTKLFADLHYPPKLDTVGTNRPIGEPF
ncbi:MAG: hypothetical protein Q9228_005733 [Teloschistes exilis]